MYEGITPESIKADMIAALTLEYDTQQGSYTDELIGAVALQIYKYYQTLNNIVPMVYVGENSGEYIDKRCAYYGITRKPGTYATVSLEYTGIAGSAIPAKSTALSSEGLQYQTDTRAVIPESGSVTVSATAADVGNAYNLPANSINRQLASVPGVTAVNNPQAAQGGAGGESDAQLVGRLYDYLQRPVASGNVHHYRLWALEVEGVGEAKVIPTWAGPGTVKVVIAGMDRGPVDDIIVSRCAAHIEEARPIGATVTVESATALPINVSAVVALDSGATLGDVRQAYASSLQDYLSEIAFVGSEVKISKALYILLGLDGVADYTAITLNSNQDNIPMVDGQVPILGEVTLMCN